MSDDKYEQLIEDTLTLINQKKIEDMTVELTDRDVDEAFIQVYKEDIIALQQENQKLQATIQGYKVDEIELKKEFEHLKIQHEYEMEACNSLGSERIENLELKCEKLNELIQLKDELLEFGARMTKENEELKHKLSLAIEALEKLDTGYNKEIVRETLDQIRRQS